MRCLLCSTEGIPATAQVCPNPECGVYLPSLFREVLPPGTRLHGGTYRIDYALARGGFGVIYRAIHVALDYPVAIKEFFPKEHTFRSNEDKALRIYPLQKEVFHAGLQQFIWEGRILVGLSHPGIVSVRDLFIERGTAYLVMELIKGQSLRRELESQPEGRMPSGQVVEIVEQLVTTLEFLHQAGVYHLDIKPENVLVTTTRHIILIDFGAARQRHSSYIAQQFDPEYAAPEVPGGEVGPQSDLFELAMMTHELLTGERPPQASERLLGRPWSITTLDKPWHELLTQALQLSKDQRPESVRMWWSEKSNHFL